MLLEGAASVAHGLLIASPHNSYNGRFLRRSASRNACSGGTLTVDLAPALHGRPPVAAEEGGAEMIRWPCAIPRSHWPTPEVLDSEGVDEANSGLNSG